MGKLRVMTILGTRPEIIRLSEVIKLCDKCFSHILVHTGQNYDYNLNEIFFKELGLRKPDYFLSCAGKHLGESMGNILMRSYEVLQREKPDAVLVLGDTNSALSAISAKRLKVPIFHMEAGNRCWDWNVPEMINRKIVDHISDVNLPYTEHARRYLLSEGLDGKMIFVTGSPMREVLTRHMDSINKSDILDRLNLSSREFFLLSAHREENVDNKSTLLCLVEAINNIAERYKKPVVYSMHPRSRKRIYENNVSFHPLVREMDPFGFLDYNKLQMNSLCVLSDSGTLSEESAMLDFPAVLIRTSTERPEVLDKGTIVIGGITTKSIEQAVDLAISLNTKEKKSSILTNYIDENVAEKIVRIMQGYTDIVNRTIWRK